MTAWVTYLSPSCLGRGKMLPVLHAQRQTIHSLWFLSGVAEIHAFTVLVLSLFQVSDFLVPIIWLFFSFAPQQFFVFQLFLVLLADAHGRFDLRLSLSVSSLNPAVTHVAD